MENNLFEVEYLHKTKTENKIERAIVTSPNPEAARTLVTEILNTKKYDFVINSCIPIFAYFPNWNNGTGESLSTMPVKSATATHSA